MSKNAYPYPPDEFDQIDLNARPKEVHAAHRNAWSRVWPFLLVIVLVPSVAFLAVHFLADKLPGGAASGSPTASQSPGSGGTSASGAPATSEPPLTPSETAPPPTTAPTAATDIPTPVIDKTIVVTVYNAGQTRGAAATAAEQLVGAGFANADKTFDISPKNPDLSTVYYSTDAQLDTANEVARVLGATAVELDPQVAGGNVVVVVK
ncbi:MAG: LytR C-terminal domain-containing protein [Bifidobacteriaceae bacterium]|nr:LytR C-terminal domain-containing protein [Bifidobacteriaceae bacterium]